MALNKPRPSGRPPAVSGGKAPYEQLLIHLITTLLGEEGSPCARALMQAAIVFLISAAVFSLGSSTQLEIWRTALICLFTICMLGYLAVRCIGGFRPTFCIAQAARKLNDEINRRRPHDGRGK